MSRPSDCHHIDWPCCGCGDEPSQEEQAEMYEEAQDFEPDCPEDDMPDNEADAQTLAMAGWGTDEDYNRYEDDLLDQEFEDRISGSGDCDFDG